MSNLGSNMCFFSSLPAYTYFREWSGGLCVGGFEPVSKPIWSEGVPADFEFGLLPDDWDQVMEASLSLAVYLSFFALSSALSLLSFSLSLSLCSISALPSRSLLSLLSLLSPFSVETKSSCLCMKGRSSGYRPSRLPK